MTIEFPDMAVTGNQRGSAPGGPALGGASQPLAFPWVQMTATLLATVGLVGWLIVAFAAGDRNAHALLGRAIRLTELHGTITYLDEVLTMSARMAAATGDASWQQRHDRSVAKLDAAFGEAMSLAGPEVAKLVAGITRVANDALIGLETRPLLWCATARKPRPAAC